MKSYVLFLLLICLSANTHAQDKIINLDNPSFEDNPRPGKAPSGWEDCGFPGETPPDVQPDPTFSVSKPAYDGFSYLGMVVRDNNTWESVSQALSSNLEADFCYQFSIYLARSETYLSVSRSSKQEANYTTPARLQIWGGFSRCDQVELLAESTNIENSEWAKHTFLIQPSKSYSHITIQAYYDESIGIYYNGHLLLDDASAFLLVDCNQPINEGESPQLVKQLYPNLPDSLNGKLDTIQLSTPESLDELDQIIKENGPAIEFHPVNHHLEKSFYLNPAGDTLFHNIPIHRIAHALQEYPGVLFIISVLPTKDQNEIVQAQYVEALKWEFTKLKFPSSRLVIRPFNDADWKREWIFDGVQTKVLMRYVLE